MEKNIDAESSIASKVFLFTFAILIALLLLSVFSGNDIRGTESNVIYTIQSVLTDNQLLYQNPNRLPYAITQYTPLYYLICDGVLSVLGIHASNVLSIIILTRFIAILFLMACGYILYQIIVRQFRHSKSLGYFFVALFIVFTFPWFSLSRPDVLVVFFTLSSLMLMIDYIHNKRLILCIFVGMCCFFAIASKQNGFMLPLAIGVYFLFTKQWKAVAFLFIGFVIGLSLTYIMMLKGGYDLTFIKENIIDGINNDLDLKYAIYQPYISFLIYFGLFCFVFFLVMKRSFKKWITPDVSVPFLLFLSLVIWFIISGILALKLGSGVNYFNEALTVMLIGVGYRLKDVESLQGFSTKRILNYLYIIGLQVCLVHFYYYPVRIVTGLYETYVSTSMVREDLSVFLKANLDQGYCFSDDRKLNLLNYSLCAFPQVEIYEASFQSSVFDSAQLEDDFMNGNIKYLILYSEIRPILNIEIEHLYEFERRIGDLNVYKFKE